MKKTGQPKQKKKVAKSPSGEPVGEASVPLQHEPPLNLSSVDKPKRGRGRPRKNPIQEAAKNSLVPLSKIDAKNNDQVKLKAHKTFVRALVDAEKLQMSSPDFDGGGTAENSQIISKESLQRRVARRLNVLDRFLTDDKLVELLAMSNLKEVGVYEAIMLDKSQVLSGQPNVIIGDTDRARMDSVLPRLLSELKRRGLIATATERKIEFTSVPEKQL